MVIKNTSQSPSGEIRVVAATVDKKQLIMITETGETVHVKQGDPRLDNLIKIIIPILAAGTGAVAVVSLENYSVFMSFNEKTNGEVKFKKVSKKAVEAAVEKTQNEVDSLEARETLEKTSGSYSSSAPKMQQESTKEDVKPVSSSGSVSSKKLSNTSEAIDNNIQSDETIVAVIGDNIIPGVEKLYRYIKHALEYSSVEGLTNFFKRLVPMMERRSHSVEDVMRFMEHGNLPIADDGSIIAYKILKSSNKDDYPGYPWRDCHSGNVPQRVGSFVNVDESLVDKSRSHECSNGLHVARRDYLGSFGGDVVVMIKLAPEDIVTVPHGDPRKVRCMGYHIIGQIGHEDFQKLKSGRTMFDSIKAVNMVARAIGGEHINRIESVKITESMGGGIVITPLEAKKQPPKKVSEASKKKAKELVESLPKDNGGGKPVDVRDINKAVNKELNQKAETRNEKAARLFKEMTDSSNNLEDRKLAGETLVALKKGAKVSYEKLGLDTNTDQIIADTMALEPPPEPKVEMKSVDKISGQLPEVPKSNNDFAKIYNEDMRDKKHGNIVSRRAAAEKLRDLKKKAKKSYKKLGLPDDTEDYIENLLK